MNLYRPFNYYDHRTEAERDRAALRTLRIVETLGAWESNPPPYDDECEAIDRALVSERTAK